MEHQQPTPDHNPLEDTLISTPFSRSYMSRESALAHFEASLTEENSMAALLRLIRPYYEAKHWNFDKIIFALDAVSDLKTTPYLLSVLRQAVESHMKKELPLGSLVSGFVELVEDRIENPALERLNSRHLAVYSEARSALIEFTRHVAKSSRSKQLVLYLPELHELTADTVTLIGLGARALDLRLYHALLTKSYVSQSMFQGVSDIEMYGAFVDLIAVKLNAAEVKFFLKISDVASSELFDLTRGIKAFAKISGALLDPERRPNQDEKWKIVSATLEAIAPIGAALIGYMEFLSDLGVNSLKPAEIQLASQAYRFHAKEVLRGSTLEELERYLSHLFGKNISEAFLGNYSKALESGHVKTGAESFELLKSMAQHALALTHIQSNSESTRRKALQDLRDFQTPRRINRIFLGDQTIEQLFAGGYDALRSRFFGGSGVNEALSFEKSGLYYLNRMLDLFYGFSALTFECKRPPSREPPLLAKFGNDVGEIKYINAKDIGDFPGRGVLIHSLKLPKIFAATENPGDPFQQYKDAWPGLALDFEDLKHASFIFCRGMIAIGCAGSKYKLIGLDGGGVHYSYVVFNEHFKNPGCKVAFLVPTRLLREKFKGSFLNFGDYLGFDPGRPDINARLTSPETLLEEGKQYPLGVIDIGSADNVVKGFSGKLRAKLMEKDGELTAAVSKLNAHILRWNHGAMYAYTTREYREIRKEVPGLRHKIQEIQEKYRTIGEDLEDVVDHYQNLFDLFRLSLSFWHKGQTAGSGSIEEQAPDQEAPTPDTLGEFEFNPHALRMLREAYAWHKHGVEAGLKRKDFPLLVKASTLDYWRIPVSPFYLDTYNLTGSINGENFELPDWSNGNGAEESEFWITKILPHMGESLDDFRFFDRKSLSML